MKAFPLVCLGASAGGLDAYVRLLGNVPAETALALVAVNHAKRYPQMLPGILSRYTRMPIHIITDGMKISPGNVYIIPSNCDLGLAGSKFVLSPLSKHFGWPRVITIFLQSLAREWRRQAIAVILSGLGADGTQGLPSIKAADGVTFAQSPASARYAFMPKAAIDSGCVDFVLPPEEIAHELVRIAVVYQNRTATRPTTADSKSALLVPSILTVV